MPEHQASVHHYETRVAGVANEVVWSGGDEFMFAPDGQFESELAGHYSIAKVSQAGSQNEEGDAEEGGCTDPKPECATR